ncbi:YbhB/YbcL family Raf kinase inhibitor-like protein [Serratia ureilytica]|uniref:YbhB/YbcL family Raf kinase inhibitor-like protein n=1 Tax=Serratia ureilytica TaxID=300181 RepID=UPI0018D87751|nr:YbhB/YbcL family Raf kinase inhibitor-like protein [Serratia ureilytica]MBH3175051.1 YbhB/YbcL family Raf kinase inhibitor-like protein [Serratia ureilytica]
MNTRIMAAMAVLSCTFAGSAMAEGTFILSSPQVNDGNFTQNQLLSNDYGFGCSGNNRSPALRWQGAPAGTRSFALQIYDRDAPTGLGWVHWQVVNIPADIAALPAGIGAHNEGLPGNAIQTRTDFGVPGYGGPCPPVGSTHRYVITLTALKTDRLPAITPDATPALVGYMTQSNALASAQLEVRQSR